MFLHPSHDSIETLLLLKKIIYINWNSTIVSHMIPNPMVTVMSVDTPQTEH